MVKREENGNEHLEAEPEHFRKIFVGGLTPSTTEEMMKDFYGKFGDVVDIVVMRDPASKRSRGFGFVTFASKSQLDECQRNRPHVIDNKTVDPKRAVPRDNNSKGEANVSSKRLYVSGVREGHTDTMFKDYFSKFGTIEKVDIVSDRATGKSRGFAFVNFTDYDSVDQCILLKSHNINGHRCDVKKGLTKDELSKAQQTERDRQERAQRSGRGGPPSSTPASNGRGGAWQSNNQSSYTPSSAMGGGGYGRGQWGNDQRGAPPSYAPPYGGPPPNAYPSAPPVNYSQPQQQQQHYGSGPPNSYAPSAPQSYPQQQQYGQQQPSYGGGNQYGGGEAWANQQHQQQWNNAPPSHMQSGGAWQGPPVNQYQQYNSARPY